MKIFILLITSLVVISCSNSKKIVFGSVMDNDVEVIKLNPHQGQKILLSNIIKDVRVVPLETSDKSLLGNISKIDVDEDFFILNDADKFVYVFDYKGEFKNMIGRRGRAKEEIIHPQCFALNNANKEVWLTNNFRAINKYDYSGKYISSENMNVFCKDFYISDDSSLYFYTAKNHNYTIDRDVINANLLIRNKESEYISYFEYDSIIHYNGCMSFDTKLQFCKSDNGVMFSYSFCDTIYSIKDDNVKPVYAIDFIKNKASIDFNAISGEDVLEYLINNPNKAAYVQNVIETPNLLRFNYAMGTQLYDVFYDKVSKKHVEGILVNDLFDGRFNIIAHNKDKIIAYMFADEIKLCDKGATFIDPIMIDKINSLNDNSNPVLIEFDIEVRNAHEI